MSTVPNTLFIKGVFLNDLVTLDILFDDNGNLYTGGHKSGP